MAQGALFYDFSLDDQTPQDHMLRSIGRFVDLGDLRRWLETQLAKISGKTPLAAAIRYALTRMKRLTLWLEHSVLELDNNTAKRSIRGIVVGRMN